MGRRWANYLLTACLLLGATGWLARLFTVKTTHEGDPSTGLVWRWQPSCARSIRVKGDDPNRVYLVREDDNAFAGEQLYDGFVDWATVVGPLGALAAMLYLRRSLRRAPHRG